MRQLKRAIFIILFITTLLTIASCSKNNQSYPNPNDYPYPYTSP